MLAGSSSSLRLDDTIVAIASAPGGGLRGIVRISGADCLAVVERLLTFTAQSKSSPLRSRLPAWTDGEIALPAPLGIIPARLLVWPTARSYTRQPTAELHTFGSPPILQAIVAAACGAGARLAKPGEFTLRAFLAGRIDLPQAEAVLGVIDAGSQAGLQAALAQLAGNLSRPLADLRERLLDLLAHLEAGLDFAEEGITFLTVEEIDAALAAAIAEVAGITAQMLSRGTANEMPRIVFAGPPNAGKSSLFNALVGAEAALVSPQAGTTRDYVSRAVKIGNRECLLIDTAGLDDAPSDEIHAAAQSFSQQAQSEADVVLWCQDWNGGVKDAPLAELNAFNEPAAQQPQNRILRILTKADSTSESGPPTGWISTSAFSGTGLDELRDAIAESLQKVHHADVVPATAARCRASLVGAETALKQARGALAGGAGDDIVAAELRLALDELGQVLGAVYTDDILDRVFSRFCIGK